MKCDQDFKDRIQLLVDINKISQREFADQLSVNEARVSDWIKGNVVNPRRTTLRKISDTFGCSIEWLAIGEGDAPIAEEKTTTLLGALDSRNNLVSVTYVEDTYASAGSGIINYESAKQVMTFDRGFLTAQLGSQQFENIHIIHAVGDSMEPTMHPGDMLFVNPGEKEIITGAIYVFVIGDETMVKRAERNPISGELTLRSDNEQYEALKIEKKDLQKVHVIGRVIGNFRKF